MHKYVYYVISFLFFAAGIVYLFNSFPGMNGFVVLENLSQKKTFLIGVWYTASSVATAVASNYDNKKGFFG